MVNSLTPADHLHAASVPTCMVLSTAPPRVHPCVTHAQNRTTGLSTNHANVVLPKVLPATATEPRWLTCKSIHHSTASATGLPRRTVAHLALPHAWARATPLPTPGAAARVTPGRYVACVFVNIFWTGWRICASIAQPRIRKALSSPSLCGALFY